MWHTAQYIHFFVVFKCPVVILYVCMCNLSVIYSAFILHCLRCKEMYAN